MTRTLYIDCSGGVAGDMLLGALLDAGAPLQAIAAGLPVAGLELSTRRVERGGAEGNLLTVAAPEQHHHRRWADVRALIDGGTMPARARGRAHAAFALLAHAEGHVHGVSPEEVTFHEVGGLDAIADICGVALALEALGIEDIVCSALPLGSGRTTGVHGVLPLPAPATLQLLRGVPVFGLDSPGETVTPTGAALVTALASSFGPLPPMTLDAIGVGAGHRDPTGVPNVVRALIGEAAGPAVRRDVTVIETNLDDTLPELVPDALEACLAAGALDAWTTPAVMKRGRPGVVFSALVRPADEERVAETLLRHTSALGVRLRGAERIELDRAFRRVEVGGEPVDVKIGLLRGEVVNLAPEHRDCVRVARATGQSTKSVWEAALAAAHGASS